MGLAAGTIDILIGTHAIFQEAVTYKDLGLVVVDEQHRFGVAQRMMLQAKGTSPHLLVMTATPIPRTLTLANYGEMDVSRLDEMPPGRQPIETRVISEDRLDAVDDALARRMSDDGERGRRRRAQRHADRERAARPLRARPAPPVARAGRARERQVQLPAGAGRCAGGNVAGAAGAAARDQWRVPNRRG